jgi:cardiolipin synthase
MGQLRPNHQVQLLQGGFEFFAALIADIDSSAHEVRFETYIFNTRGEGDRIAQALERAALRGVLVYLVMDGVGTPAMTDEWAKRLDAAGVNWHIFSPLGRWGLLIPSRWRRLHRKLCVVDGRVAYCGGVNVLDDFYDPNHGDLEFPRFDFSVRVIGPLVQSVHEATARFWWRVQAVRNMTERDFQSAWLALEKAVQVAMASHHQKQIEPINASSPCARAKAELVLRDNLLNRSRIEKSYRKAIGEAQSEIIIANAYFLPGRKLRKGLIHAAQRGVRVRLLLQGRYEYFMQFHATRPVYEALLAAGVEIHEYTASFLHAKVAVIDGHWATVGSSNLDPLSLLLAREANVVVDDVVFAQLLRSRLLSAMEKGGLRIDPEAYTHRPWRQRVLDLLSLGLVRLMLFLYGKRY